MEKMGTERNFVEIVRNQRECLAMYSADNYVGLGASCKLKHNSEHSYRPPMDSDDNLMSLYAVLGNC